MTTNQSAGSPSSEQDDAEALLNLARQELRTGRFAQAEAIYRQILAQRPGVATLHNEFGNLLRRQGRLDEAAAQYQSALALQPELFEAHSGVASILRRQGRFDEAIAQLEQAIAQRPDIAEAHNNLGILLCEQGKLDQALPRFQRALQLRPGYADATRNLARALADLGRSDEAVVMYQQALVLEPRHFLAHFALSSILCEKGQFDQAIDHLRQAIAIRPDSAEAYFNLGNALKDIGRLDLAVPHYQRSLALKPAQANVRNNLANARRELGQLELAVADYRQALALRPDYAEAHSNLAIALAELGQTDEALTHFDQALALRPDHVDAHSNLAVALQGRGDIESALAHFDKALSLRPDDPDAHGNLAAVLSDQGQIDEALAHSDQALALRPEYPNAHLNRAMVRLLRGDFEQGWAEYEWRWKCPGFVPPDCWQPRWQGESLAGKRMMLFTEQGLGDTLQFIRYAKLLKERGASVLVCTAKPLQGLLRLLPYLDGVFPADGELPDFDVQLPMLSLPHVLGTTLETISAGEPYLIADGALVERWRDRLSKSGGFQIGINWQGNPKYRGDRRRSIPLEQFAPLAAVPGVNLISLQKGFGAEQLPHAGFPVVDLGPDFDEGSGPFMDTAAVLKNLDLLITPDTALSHLAGGMGVPTWLALPRVPDWRWLLDREDSPWYPTVRLFRQSEAGCWEPVFVRIAAALGELLDTRTKGS